MNNQYLAPFVVFPHCIVLLLGSFTAWSGDRLCLRRPEWRCHDLLHEGDFPPLFIASYWWYFIYKSDISAIPYLSWLSFVFALKATHLYGSHDIKGVSWRQRIIYHIYDDILKATYLYGSHEIKGVSRRLACSRFQLWPLRGVEHKIQGAVMFLFWAYCKLEIFLFACFCF